jgi:hypothetical protein
MSAGKEASPKEPDILKVRAELLQALKGPHDESELVCAVESGAKFYNENPDDTEVGEALDWAQKRTAGRWPPKRC